MEAPFRPHKGSVPDSRKSCGDEAPKTFYNVEPPQRQDSKPTPENQKPG
ncbi:hypothetical protein HMPREF1981_02810, partial [Bacteroides pyogenes F0041]